MASQRDLQWPGRSWAHDIHGRAEWRERCVGLELDRFPSAWSSPAPAASARRPPLLRRRPASLPARCTIRPGLPFPARPSRSRRHGRIFSEWRCPRATAGSPRPSLAPGDYRLDVELAGFKPLRREGVRLATGETVRIDFDLAVGGLQERGDSGRGRAGCARRHVEPRDVVDNRQVEQLPLNGRGFMMLRRLVPGVAMPRRRPPRSPRINGGRPRTNEYLFDGISVLQPEPGQVAYFPNHRRHPGVQDREQQPAGRVRAVQWRRGQPDDQGRHQ